jgi:hypothetical protein
MKGLILQENIEFSGIADRRCGTDRRQNRFPTLKGLCLQRRRSDLRRRSDRSRIVILDRYSSTGLWVVTMVLLLSVADAFLTLFLLNHGAVELNPVMAYFIDIGPYAFVGSKYLITVGSVLIVVVLNYTFIRYLRFHARQLIKIFAAAFGSVVVWEFYLIFQYVI